jgi:hypothetical protein
MAQRNNPPQQNLIPVLPGGKRTISLRVLANGKVLISPEQLANATIALPPEIVSQGLSVVFMQNATSTVVGLTKDPPQNLQLTPISELRAVRQINKRVAEIHKSTVSPEKEEALKDVYTNLKELVKTPTVPHQSLKAELLDGKILVDKTKILIQQVEQLDQSKPGNIVLGGFIKRTLLRLIKAQEDMLRDLYQGKKKDIKAYMLENEVPKWLFNKVSEPGFNPGQNFKPLQFLYPKGKFYLTGKELMTFTDAFYLQSQVISSFHLPKIKENCKREKKSFLDLIFIIKPPINTKILIGDGQKPSEIPLSEVLTSDYNHTIARCFGRLNQDENLNEFSSKELGLDTQEELTTQKLIRICKENTDESPIDTNIISNEWYLRTFGLTVPEVEVQRTDQQAFDYIPRLFRPSTKEFVDDDYWRGARVSSSSNIRLELRRNVPEALQAYSNLKGSKMFSHLAAPVANLLSEIENSAIRLACYERVMAAIMTAKMQGRDDIPILPSGNDSDEEPESKNREELPPPDPRFDF